MEKALIKHIKMAVGIMPVFVLSLQVSVYSSDFVYEIPSYVQDLKILPSKLMPNSGSLEKNKLTNDSNL